MSGNPSATNRCDPPAVRHDDAPGRRTRGHRRHELFPVLCVAMSALAFGFVGATVLTIAVNGLTHFRAAVSSAEVLFSLRMSMLTSTVSTAVCLLLALPTAHVLTRMRIPGRRAVEVLMELTLSLPYVVLGFALLIMFSSPAGRALRDAGLAVVFRPSGIVLAQLIVNIPFSLRMVRTAFAEVDPRMEFVAKTLGASSWATFATVTLPACRNQVVSALVLTWARGMGEFGATLMLVGVTRMRTETLPGSIYLSISTGNTDTAMATAMVMLLVSAATLVVTGVLNGTSATRTGRGGR